MTPFYFLAVFIFCVFALLIRNVQRSTTGLQLAAVRCDSVRASTMGIRSRTVRVWAFAIGTFVAGVGGGLLAIYQLAAVPSNFVTEIGLVWFAVVVTFGLRSLTAVLAAGFAYTVIPQLFSSYLPMSLSEVPTILFGLGAIVVARHPEGIISMHAQQFKQVRRRLSGSRLSPKAGRGEPVQATSA